MSERRETVSDTGPLITLEKLDDGYRFIRLLYDKIIIPRTVLDELTQGLPGIELLDAGERDAIQIALERGLPLLIEEETGRQYARRLSLQISGIAGQIVKAFRTGLISSREAQDKLQELFGAGRINRKIHAALTATVRQGS